MTNGLFASGIRWVRRKNTGAGRSGFGWPGAHGKQRPADVSGVGDTVQENSENGEQKIAIMLATIIFNYVRISGCRG